MTAGSLLRSDGLHRRLVAAISPRQVLRNSSVGSMWISAASGPRLQHRDLNQHIFRRFFGDTRRTHRIAIVVENASVEQFILQVVPSAPFVGADQIA